MSNPTSLVQKLWNFCNILRDDGFSYGDYVEQLTFLLFLKMVDEQSRSPFVKVAGPSRLCSGDANQRPLYPRSSPGPACWRARGDSHS